jgi:hypothetical protein
MGIFKQALQFERTALVETPRTTLIASKGFGAISNTRPTLYLALAEAQDENVILLRNTQ